MIILEAFQGLNKLTIRTKKSMFKPEVSLNSGKSVWTLSLRATLSKTSPGEVS